jgi:hypothetical protein
LNVFGAYRLSDVAAPRDLRYCLYTDRAMKIAYRLSSNLSSRCPFCEGVQLDGLDEFLQAVRHLQEFHNLECLHVGTETTYDGKGSCHTTVAIFGSENPPKELPPPELIIEVTNIGTGRKITLNPEAKTGHGDGDSDSHL